MPTTTSKSIDDFMSEVRLLINDVGIGGTSFRYSNDQVLAVFNTAIRELYRYRTDAYIGNFTQGILTNNTVPTFSTADLAQAPAVPFPVDDRLFYNAIVFFVVGRLELGDDEFTDQSRSAQLLASFRQMLVGEGG